MLFLGGGIAAFVPFGLVVAAPGGKLTYREGNLGEQLAGVFGAAGIVAAFLGGYAVIQHWDDNLGIPLQSDDRELPQGHKQPPPVPG